MEFKLSNILDRVLHYLFHTLLIHYLYLCYTSAIPLLYIYV